MRDKFTCPVCLNDIGQVSKDGGETWQCDMCMGFHDGEKRLAQP